MRNTPYDHPYLPKPEERAMVLVRDLKMTPPDALSFVELERRRLRRPDTITAKDDQEWARLEKVTATLHLQKLATYEQSKKTVEN